MLVLGISTLGEITENDLLACTTLTYLVALLTQEFLPQFKAQSSGNIIILEEPLVRFCTRFSFAASKFAVRGMTQSWQAELRKYIQ
jgi:3-oxoacyl-[acyl-carrier protein] reductase